MGHHEMAGLYYHFDGGHRVQVTECGLVVCLRMGVVMMNCSPEVGVVQMSVGSFVITSFTL